MTGIICINKDRDISSFGTVARLRGITGERKAGHTGTLDPMATGVLPVMLGGATRFLDFLPDSDKAYRAGFILGKTTDTLDITGTVTAEYPVTVTEHDVISILPKFTGSINQLPPMYSAVSVNGQRLYDLARKGVEVERQQRSVEIKRLDFAGFADGEYTIDVLCSKGTYIRTLIDDIGKELGCGAVMTRLQRTQAMGFSLDQCVTLDELQRLKDSGEGFGGVLIDLEKIFEPYEKVTVSEAQAKRFSNGGALSTDRIKKKLTDGIYRVYNPQGLFLGLGRVCTEKQELAVARLLVKRD